MSKKNRFGGKADPPFVQPRFPDVDPVLAVLEQALGDPQELVRSLGEAQPCDGSCEPGACPNVEGPPPGEPFLALSVVKRGAHWHAVELDCVMIDNTVTVRDVRFSNACTRVQAIAHFKTAAVRKKVTA